VGFTAPVDTESWYPHYLNLICETCTEGVKGRSQRGAHTCEPTTEMFGPTAPELRDVLSPPKKLDSGQSCLDIEFLSINYRGLNFPNFPIELGGGNSDGGGGVDSAASGRRRGDTYRRGSGGRDGGRNARPSWWPSTSHRPLTVCVSPLVEDSTLHRRHRRRRAAVGTHRWNSAAIGRPPLDPTRKLHYPFRSRLRGLSCGTSPRS